MDLQGVFAMVMLSVFFAIPVLYVWKIKHPSRSLWKLCACFVVILYGPPFVASFFLGSLMDFVSHSVGYIFQMTHQASTAVAREVLTALAAFTAFPTFYITTKIIHRPLVNKKKTGSTALYSATVATQLNQN